MTQESRAEMLASEALAAWEGGDAEAAETMWLQAASLGSARAMVNLGRNRYEEGDLEGAAQWFSSAVDAGSAEGAVLMGRLAADRGDEAELEAWRWRAVDLGDVAMTLWLAYRDPDPGESFNVALMERAAQSGAHHACALMCARAMERDEYTECLAWGEMAMASKEQEENPEQLARLHAVIGYAYRYTDQPAPALMHLEQALALAPDAVTVSENDLMELRRELGDGARTRGAFPDWREASPPTTVSEEPDDALPGQGFCTACGAVRVAGALFCTQCGGSLG